VAQSRIGEQSDRPKDCGQQPSGRAAAAKTLKDVCACRRRSAFEDNTTWLSRALSRMLSFTSIRDRLCNESLAGDDIVSRSMSSAAREGNWHDIADHCCR
jgi:hypothetical protein